MRIVIGAQLVVTALLAVIVGLMMAWGAALSVVYGATLGIVATLLIKRSADRALRVAEKNPRYGFATLFSGLLLRYAVVILGLLIGFRVLQLAAVPLIGGFVLMIIVLVVASVFTSPDVRPEAGTKRTD